LRHISDVSAEDIFDVPHSHPFIARPREPSRISEGDEAAAEEVDATAQHTKLPFHEHATTTQTVVVEQQPENGRIAEMQDQIEVLRQELSKRDSEVRELEELRKENALLKQTIESLRITSATERGTAIETLP